MSFSPLARLDVALLLSICLAQNYLWVIDFSTKRIVVPPTLHWISSFAEGSLSVPFGAVCHYPPSFSCFEIRDGVLLCAGTLTAQAGLTGTYSLAGDLLVCVVHAPPQPDGIARSQLAFKRLSSDENMDGFHFRISLPDSAGVRSVYLDQHLLVVQAIRDYFYFYDVRDLPQHKLEPKKLATETPSFHPTPFAVMPQETGQDFHLVDLSLFMLSTNKEIYMCDATKQSAPRKIATANEV